MVIEKFSSPRSYLPSSYPYPTRSCSLPPSPLDPCHLTLAERVRLFDHQQQRDRSSNPHLLLPRPPSARRRHHHGSSLSARFQTQPITIDEVQQASRQIGIQQQQQQQQHRLSQQRPVSSGGSEGVAALRSIFVGRGAATTQHHPTSAPELLNSPTISLSLHTLSGGGGVVFGAGFTVLFSRSLVFQSC